MKRISRSERQQMTSTSCSGLPIGCGLSFTMLVQSMQQTCVHCREVLSGRKDVLCGPVGALLALCHSSGRLLFSGCREGMYSNWVPLVPCTVRVPCNSSNLYSVGCSHTCICRWIISRTRADVFQPVSESLFACQL